MTAEVAILNRLGVALAADSAVTLGGAESKIYTSADKLFLLSERTPVGALIYGNSNFAGVPWETVLKLYRQKRRDVSFGTLEECATDLIDFLQSNHGLFPEDVQTEYVKDHCRFIFWSVWYDDFASHIRATIEEVGELTQEQVEEHLDAYLQDKIEEITQLDNYEHLPDDVSEKLLTRYSNAAVEALGDIFEVDELAEETSGMLVQLALSMLTKRSLDVFLSGVVVAGFGANQHFPTLIEFNVRGIAADHLLYCKERQVTIGHDAEAAVIPFAQQEMVYTFMEGVDPSLRRLIEESTRDLFSGVIGMLLQQVKNSDALLGEDLEERIGNSLPGVVEQLIQQWSNHCRVNYAEPVINIVSALPKDELGAMAESLVNLTKFKRRVSLQQETVGGPIDVAVITKGDGFVWIQRKHYFQAELNPRFIARYSMGGN